MPAARHPVVLSKARARQIWLRAQKLHEYASFGHGPEATRAAVEHLGYVQIDTINVIERCHHHILYTRIPEYRPEHLRQAQTIDKTVFEYWAHALAYLPTRDIRFCIADMRRRWRRRANSTVTPEELRRVLSLIRQKGVLSIRDINDDVLVQKDHPWASRKPSERALSLAFDGGRITVSERVGILKAYALSDRHFGWEKPPHAAPESETLNYLLDRALRCQGIVSLESVCYLDAPRKPAMRQVIDARVHRRHMLRVNIEGADNLEHWVRPELLEDIPVPACEQVHILSPFDPLVIQRKRLKFFFGYEHRFEAYVPKSKRQFGYFALPMLVGDEIVAAIDLKTDRQNRKLLVQQWTWVGRGRPRAHKKQIEAALDRFEEFQLGEKRISRDTSDSRMKAARNVSASRAL